MKTTIDKGQVMRRAWRIYRQKKYTSKFGFRYALIDAWDIEKRNAAYAQRKAEEAADRAIMAARKAEALKERRGADMPIVHDFREALINWYSNAPRGTYFGD